MLAVLIGAAINTSALTLVKDGKANATIIIAKNAPYKNQLAAKDLQMFLRKISGAQLPITTDDNKVKGNKILLGRSSYLDKLKLKIPSGYSLKKIHEGFIIKTIGDNLVLAGNDGGPKVRGVQNKKRPYLLPTGGAYKGSMFATYAFLEELGCRWFFPGEFGEVLPSMKTIKIGKLNIRETPSFMFRGYWMKTHTLKAMNAYDAFFHRNRFLSYHAGFRSARDGSIMKQVPAKKYFKTHPEYFGLNKDLKTRNREVLCATNPNVIKIISEKAKDFFRKNPNIGSWGIAPNDGQPACWCKECQHLSGNIMIQDAEHGGKSPCISGAFYALLNKVARNVGKEFPGKIIGTTIYAGRLMPPPSQYKFEPNTSGYLAMLEYSQMRPLDDPNNWETRQMSALFKSWKERLDNFIYRPYYPSFMVHCNLPMPMPRNVIADIKFLNRPENKPKGMKWEGWSSWNTSYLNYYIRGKMLWDAEADGEKILADFYEKFYGPAAPYIEKFYTAIENAIVKAPFNTHEEELLPEIFSYKFVSKLMPYISQAEKAVKNSSPAYRQRVKMARLTAEHVLLYSKMRDVAERNYNYKEAADIASKMLILEKKMMEICPNFINIRFYKRDKLKTYRPYGANFSPLGKQMQYRNVDKLMNGEQGALVAKMPRIWKFKTDPVKEGIPASWFNRNIDTKNWKNIEIGRCVEVQGYYNNAKTLVPYLGDMWYTCEFDVSKKFTDRELAMFIGGINNEAWVWINGQLIGHQPFHTWWMRFKYSWTKPIAANIIRSGKNRMTVKVFAGDRFGFGGIFRNIFVYAPNKTKAKK